MTQAANLAALGTNAGTTGILPIAGGGTAGTNGAIGFKNKLINGNMQIWQRGTAFSAPANSTYTADRWASTWGTANRTVSQQTGFSGAQYCMRVARNVGTTDASYTGIQQVIETANVIPFQGQTVTLSFTARAGANFSAASNQLLVGTQAGSGVDQGVVSAWTASWTNNSYPTMSTASVNLTTTATTYSTTCAVPANCQEFAVTFYYLSSGTAGAADYFEITNIQLEVGTAATNFDVRSYGTELQLCQRYYEKSYDQGTVPGSSNTLSQSIGLGIYTNTPAAYNRFGNIYFKVTKRTTPTIVQYAPATGNSAASGNATSGDGGTDIGYTTPNQISTGGFNIAASVGGSTNTNYYTGFFAYTASAEL